MRINKRNLKINQFSVMDVSKLGIQDAKYFKDVTLNGQTIRCYVNMGSRAVALRKEDAKCMKTTYSKMDVGRNTVGLRRR